MSIIAWLAFGFGAFLCVTNFYLSFLRYALHRLRGLSQESFRLVSGFPLVGSLLVAFSLLALRSLPFMLPVGIALIAIDTGGIHWFIGTMIYHSVRGKTG
jgi:hypothetical protein